MENFLLRFLGLVNPANDIMAGVCVLYAELFGVLLFIIFALMAILYVCIVIYNGLSHKRVFIFSRETEMLLDFIFLLFPTFVILYILIPTLGFIFNSDFSNTATLLNINVIGHQWYWTYEYPSNICIVPGWNIVVEPLQVDSFMDAEVNLNRLLEVTDRLVVPTGHFIGLHITSSDVIHSFAIPQLGIKVDAIPGRIAQIILYVPTSGIYRGQCSELCGAYHGFMPVVLEAVPLNKWYGWYWASIKVSPFKILLQAIVS